MRNSKAMNVEPPKTLVEDERNPPTRVPSDTDSLDSAADLSEMGAMALNRNGLYGEGSEGGDLDSEQGGTLNTRQLGHQSNGEISVTEYEDAPLHDGKEADYNESVSMTS